MDPDLELLAELAGNRQSVLPQNDNIDLDLLASQSPELSATMQPTIRPSLGPTMQASMVPTIAPSDPVVPDQDIADRQAAGTETYTTSSTVAPQPQQGPNLDSVMAAPFSQTQTQRSFSPLAKKIAVKGAAKVFAGGQLIEEAAVSEASAQWERNQEINNNVRELLVRAEEERSGLQGLREERRAARDAAFEKIDKLSEDLDNKEDAIRSPEKFISDMGAGQKVGLVIAGIFGGARGNPDSAVRLLDQMIAQDIAYHTGRAKRARTKLLDTKGDWERIRKEFDTEEQQILFRTGQLYKQAADSLAIFSNLPGMEDKKNYMKRVQGKIASQLGMTHVKLASNIASTDRVTSQTVSTTGVPPQVKKALLDAQPKNELSAGERQQFREMKVSYQSGMRDADRLIEILSKSGADKIPLVGTFGADEVELKKVWMRLALNAREAMNDSGPIQKTDAAMFDQIADGKETSKGTLIEMAKRYKKYATRQYGIQVATFAQPVSQQVQEEMRKIGIKSRNRKGD